MTIGTLKYAFAVGFLLAGMLGANATTPAPEKLSAPGLAQPVEILKDKWGISHIYAQNENDLFFAQGYNAARDRNQARIASSPKSIMR